MKTKLSRRSDERSVVASLMRNRKGSAAAEFALVLPVLTSMIFGALEFSSIFFSYSAMQSAARDVARQVAVNTIPQEGAEEAVKERLPVWMREAIDVDITQTTPNDITTNVIQMRVEIPAVSATPLKLFTKSADWVLTTQVEMKQETPFEEPEA